MAAQGDVGDLKGLGVQVDLLLLVGLAPDAAIALLDEPVGVGRASVGHLADVGLDDADRGLLDVGHRDLLDLEEPRVEPVLAGGEHGGLRALVALALAQEELGVEHRVDVHPLGRVDLARRQDPAVGGGEQADLALADLDHRDLVHVVDDGPLPEVPARPEDAGLGALLAVGGDDLPLGQLAGGHVLDDDADLILAHVADGGDRERAGEDQQARQDGRDPEASGAGHVGRGLGHPDHDGHGDDES